jgi:hypothetical protein
VDGQVLVVRVNVELGEIVSLSELERMDDRLRYAMRLQRVK